MYFFIGFLIAIFYYMIVICYFSFNGFQKAFIEKMGTGLDLGLTIVNLFDLIVIFFLHFLVSFVLTYIWVIFVPIILLSVFAFKKNRT